jgi:hypothetical protein
MIDHAPVYRSCRSGHQPGWLLFNFVRCVQDLTTDRKG